MQIRLTKSASRQGHYGKPFAVVAGSQIHHYGKSAESL